MSPLRFTRPYGKLIEQRHLDIRQQDARRRGPKRTMQPGEVTRITKQVCLLKVLEENKVSKFLYV